MTLQEVSLWLLGIINWRQAVVMQNDINSQPRAQTYYTGLATGTEVSAQWSNTSTYKLFYKLTCYGISHSTLSLGKTCQSNLIRPYSAAYPLILLFLYSTIDNILHIGLLTLCWTAEEPHSLQSEVIGRLGCSVQGQIS